MNEKTIASAEVKVESEIGVGKVDVVYTDGSIERLFHWFVDEYTFAPEEFIGKTRAEAIRLHFDRDVAFLRS